jgi:hypothetical protein
MRVGCQRRDDYLGMVGWLNGVRSGPLDTWGETKYDEIVTVNLSEATCIGLTVTTDLESTGVYSKGTMVVI